MSVITIKINASTPDELTGKAVSNAVRRAFGTSTEVLTESGEVKGLRFSVRPTTNRTKTSTPKTLTEAGVIRQWARQNSVEVGKRGRIHPDVKAAYQAAQGAEVK